MSRNKNEVKHKFSISDESDLANYDWLCSRLGISPNTARRWVMQRRLPFIKLANGSLVRFKKNDIEAWLENSKVEVSQ